MRHRVLFAAAMTAALPAAPGRAQSADELRALRDEIVALRAEQRASASRIADLEAALAARGTSTATAPQPMPTWTEPPSAAPRRIDLSGDLRLRYESNFGDERARGRGRTVFRARLRAAYAVNDWLTVGGQVATGDPDDPNSTDVTLTGFADDFQISLDQAYARASFGHLTLVGGKIPQPFVRTDLVWDGDVSPTGVSAAYRLPLGQSGALKAVGFYFAVDEAAAGPDSDMAGIQFGFESTPGARWRVELAGGYFDYALRSVAGADAGDFRTNLLRPDGRYLSDFNLMNGIAALSYQGFGPRWPVRLAADYVKNLGARTDGDSGFAVELAVGRSVTTGDWRIGYGYSEAGVDAVLAAFSHDNMTLATNYIQHALSVDYALRERVLLNATLYHYRLKNPLHADATAPTDWIQRLRANLLMTF